MEQRYVSNIIQLIKDENRRMRRREETQPSTPWCKAEDGELSLDPEDFESEAGAPQSDIVYADQDRISPMDLAELLEPKEIDGEDASHFDEFTQLESTGILRKIDPAEIKAARESATRLRLVVG